MLRLGPFIVFFVVALIEKHHLYLCANLLLKMRFHICDLYKNEQ